MKAQYENVVPGVGRSFNVVQRTGQRFDAPWHYHPEFELTLILESRGRRFVGDSIEEFVAGDLVLLGSNLPHFWHNEGRRRKGERSRAVVVQFRRDFLGHDFFTKPELGALFQLLQKSERGLSFNAADIPSMTDDLLRLPEIRGVGTVVLLLSVLDRLAHAAARPLASHGYAPLLNADAQARLTRVYTFLLARFRDPLTLHQIARSAGMSSSAFSRYFKQATGLNVFAFLTELRIGHAARKLQETSRGIAEIAFESGYESLSSFNRRFREQFDCSPRDYRKQFKT